MGEFKAPEDTIPAASIGDLKIRNTLPSMEDLNGSWVLEKHLSSNIAHILKLQKIPFLLRHAITSSPIHLSLTHYTSTDAGGQKHVHFDLVQRSSPSLNLGVIEDKRVLDWVEREHEDFVFGKVLTRSRSVRGGAVDGLIRPDIQLNVHVEGAKEVLRFLRGEVDVDGARCEGFLVEDLDGEDASDSASREDGIDLGGGRGLWVHTLECSEKAAWSAETIWGFEMVNGERYLTSRVVAVDGKGNYQLGRCVFRFLNREA